MEYKVQLIIPTFSHPYTLPWSIRSAQNQSIQAARIVVIGDGVTDETREIIYSFQSEDSRIHFMDRPKASRHGEEYRHESIKKFNDPFVAYLGDDDLLFPNHLETLIEAIEDRDFVHSFPTVIRPDQSILTVPTQISDERFVQWHLNEEKRNSISLTGAMHTRESYFRLPIGWTPAPKSDYSDHYMWKKFFTQPDFRGVTSKFATTAKFASDLRVEMTPAQREFEISDFWAQMQESNFQDEWNIKVSHSLLYSAQELLLAHTYQQSLISHQSSEIVSLQIKAQELEDYAESARLDLAHTSQKLTAIMSSQSWKLMGVPRVMHKFIKKIFGK